MDPLKHVIGTEEAARMWGLSQDHVKLLCRQGKVRSKRIGKTWVVDATQPNPKGGMYKMFENVLLDQKEIVVQEGDISWYIAPTSDGKWVSWDDADPSPHIMQHNSREEAVLHHIEGAKASDNLENVTEKFEQYI